MDLNPRSWLDPKSLITAVLGGVVALLGDWFLEERRAVLDLRGQYVARHQEDIRRFRQLARLGSREGERVRVHLVSREDGKVSIDSLWTTSLDTVQGRLLDLPGLVLDPELQRIWEGLREDLEARRDSAPPVLIESFDRIVRWVDRHPFPADSAAYGPLSRTLEEVLHTAWGQPDSLARWYTLNAELEGRADGLLSLNR